MNERVVSLSDRGRALEWLSLGFGILLVAGLIDPIMALDMSERSILPESSVSPAPGLALACAAAHLVALSAIAIGAVKMCRTGAWFWFGFALAALAGVLVCSTAVVWVPHVDLDGHAPDWPVWWSSGALPRGALLAAVFLGVRETASREGHRLPMSVLGVLLGGEIALAVLLGGFRFDGLLARDPMLPWVRAALVAVATLLTVGLLLLALREASRVVRAQIWADEPGVTSPARAGDWQRAAAGLDAFGAFLIGKIAIGAAAIPLLIVGALAGLGAFEAVQFTIVPVASAACSAGMVAALLASRRIPDPPDARTGFTGAALLVAACIPADLYLPWARADEPLAGAISALGHVVAYVAVLRSIGRIGERLGEEEFTRRARALSWLAIAAVGGASGLGYLLLRDGDDIALWFVVPITVAGVAFAVLLPCAMLSRELARRLRTRFAEPPRAVARVQPS